VVTICDLKVKLIASDAECEILGETRCVSSHCLVKRLRRHTIEVRQVGIEHHLFAAKKKNELGHTLRLQSELLFHPLTTASLLHLRVPTFAALGDEAVDAGGDYWQWDGAKLQNSVVEGADVELGAELFLGFLACAHDG